MGRVIAVSNLKGGIGKTTTVVNIGAGLALKGARVLLVDVDAQGNLAMALGVQPRRTVYEVMVEGAAAADCVTPARPNLDLLASDHTLLGAQPEIAKRHDWSRVLEHALRPLLGSYDFIFVDSGGSLTPLNINALMAARDIIAPTAIEHFSVKSLEMLFQQVARVKGNSAAIRMIVPTMYDPRVRQSDELLNELREHYGPLIGPAIRINVRLSEAPRMGKTIYEYDPRSRGAADYAQLVERLSALFSFEPPRREPAPSARMPVAPIRSPAPATNGSATNHQPPPPRTPTTACPNCGHPLKHVTLAGYHVTYCDHCRYKTQTLAREPRR